MDLSDDAVHESPALHDDSTASARSRESRQHRKQLLEAWVGTQLRLIAATGLASSHSGPFARVLYHIPDVKQKSSAAEPPKVISLENEDSEFRLRRGHNGRYTAIWGDPTSPEGDFRLPPSLEYVEIQLWNHFPNGFEVFLGMTTVSIQTLYHQLCDENETLRPLPTDEAPSSILSSQAMWYPLQMSRQNAHAAQMDLSVQLEVSFLRDLKAYGIRQKIAQNAVARKKSRSADVDGGDSAGMSEAKSIADPTFAFTKPFYPVDWSSVVSTSLRHIFFHADVDRLSSFGKQVLYGDLLRELQEDEGLHIHEDHLAAFQLCQLSAQYLDHCVNTLSARSDEYSDQYRVLAENHRQLSKTRSRLKRHRDRLKKESNELDLLLATYKSIAAKDELSAMEDEVSSEATDALNTRGHTKASSPSKTRMELQHVSPLARSSKEPHGDALSKKPAFLMTWEERERERKLEKELSKAKRIEEEKRRLEQSTQDRKAREEHQYRLSSLLARGRERASRAIQRFFRHKCAEHNRKLAITRCRAAVTIQSRWRGYMCKKVYPARLEQHNRAMEARRMAQSELEMRTFLRDEEQHREQNRILEALHDRRSASSSPSKHEVGALVSMWRNLRRIFVVAHASGGSAYGSLYAKLDLRQDGVVDRAELRLGVRSFGIRIDRKLTRALIALVRAKSGAPPQPLHMSFDQFVRGFELPQDDDGGSQKKSSVSTFPDRTISSYGGGRLQERSTAGKELREMEEQELEDAVDSDERDDTATTVARAVENLRQKIIEAATSHLEAKGKPVSSYRDFRDALMYVFEGFDVDRNGELDMNEFVTCIESINFHVTEENLALLRECFACDHDGDKIGIAEFISFALARPELDGGGDENLGVVGSRLRDAILQRVRSARKQTDTIEDAVRFVFRRAYRSKTDQSCSVGMFMKALAALQLGIKAAQLARLVMRLDKDGDRSISFDELLVWLRLRSPAERTTSESPPTFHRQNQVAAASAIAKLVRSVVHQLAGVDRATSPLSRRHGLLRIFETIDRNDNKKVTKQEIQDFLAMQDLSSMNEALSGITDSGSSPTSIPTSLADAIVNSIDLNRNGVVTLDEWLEFLEQMDGNREQMDRFAMVDSVRAALQTAIKDEGSLTAWFHGLPGAIPVPALGKNGEAQMKVRIGELKSALRTKIGAASSLPLQAIEEAVKRLDSDSSGWITTHEMQSWAFPLRDLDEVLRTIVDRWQDEARVSNPDGFALTLYNRFDADGNGILAQREIRGGFASFGLQFRQEEVAALAQAFDLDHDGCWSRAEFLAFVYKIFPHEIFPRNGADAERTTSDRAVDDSDDAYEQDGFSPSSSLSAASSSPSRDSPQQSPYASVSGSRAVAYSEDFD